MGMLRRLDVSKCFILAQSLVCSLIFSVPCIAQGNGGPYLVRLEHQTREENVCILVQRDGNYHLERTALGHPRVFEGTLAAPVVSELEPYLNAPQLVELKQTQIDASAGEDMDQFMMTVPRAGGWQKLIFPSSKSRKPYKAEMDPILKWLDRNKQQQNPIAESASNRCVPSQSAQAGTASSTTNPYMLRIVLDSYELKGGGTVLSSVSGAKGTTSSGPVGGVTNAGAMDTTGFRITRICAVVYDSGRYRFEKSLRDSGNVVRSEVYRDALDKTQLAGLRELLDNQKLAALPSNTTPPFFGRESEFTTLAIPRPKSVQTVSVVTSAPAARDTFAGPQEAAYQALGANAGLTNPIRKWVKQNIESRKGDPLKEVPLDACIPSPLPE